MDGDDDDDDDLKAFASKSLLLSPPETPQIPPVISPTPSWSLTSSGTAHSVLLLPLPPFTLADEHSQSTPTRCAGKGPMTNDLNTYKRGGTTPPPPLPCLFPSINRACVYRTTTARYSPPSSYLILPISMPQVMVELLSLLLAVILGFGWATAAVPHPIRPYSTSTWPQSLASQSPNLALATSQADPDAYKTANLYSIRRVKRAKLIITEGEVEIAGIATPAVLVNGTIPGPALRFHAGDIAIVNVTNLMTSKNTTMHWHGLSQRQTPRADGTLMSQWAIAPGKWFEYEMHLTEEDIGTRFYHSHVGMQADTMSGAFIVEEPVANPYHWDEERVLLVKDWWHKSGEVMAQGLLADSFKWVGSPNMTLVNGEGMTADLKGEPHYIDVEYGKTYLLRWIGGQGLQYYSIGIMEHTPYLVEVDSTWVRKYKGDSIVELGPGNRIAQLLESKSRDRVRNDGLDGCYGVRLESAWRRPPTNGWAVVRYPGGCPDGFVPPNANNSLSLLREAQFGWIANKLRPLQPYRVLRDDEVSFTYVIDSHQVKLPTMTLNATGQIRWKGAEDYSYVEDFPNIPYMIQLYAGLRERPSWERAMNPPAGIQPGYDSVAQAFVAKSSTVVDILLLNNASLVSNNTEVHSWHFHSSKFQHVASGEGDFSREKLAQIRAEKGWKYPLPSDMVTVWPGTGAVFYNKTIPRGTSGSWSLIRYEVKEEQSGIWPLHCHMLPHFVMGMATIIAVDPHQIASTVGFYDDPNYLLFGRNVKAPYTLWEDTVRVQIDVDLRANGTSSEAFEPERGATDEEGKGEKEEDVEGEADEEQRGGKHGLAAGSRGSGQ